MIVETKLSYRTETQNKDFCSTNLARIPSTMLLAEV